VPDVPAVPLPPPPPWTKDTTPSSFIVKT
jgi:hypothetical protein